MLSINISELIWTVINFFLLLFVLKRFLFDPVLRFTDERQARIDAGTEAERQAQAKRDENARELEEQKAEARRAAAELVNASAAEDAKRTSAAYAEAREAAASLQTEGERALQERHAQEQEALRAGEPELAGLLAARLLGEKE